MEVSDALKYVQGADIIGVLYIVGGLFVIWLLIVLMSHKADIAEGNFRQKMVKGLFMIVLIASLTLLVVWEHYNNYEHLLEGFEYTKNLL